jgi:recombination protein RecA
MPKKADKKAEPVKKTKEPNQQDPKAAKEEALGNALAQIEKAYGKGAVMKFGEKNVLDVPVVTTGILSVDVALGVGGVPKGRIVEVYGPESSGKTTLALHIVSETQKLGGIAGYVDAEHALDPVYARKLGVDIDELYISQPDNGEQALEIAEAMVRSGAIDIVVVDSVAALVPRAEIEGDMGASHVGLQARLMSQALRKLTGITSKTNCIVIFINQLRDKIGVTYGSPETTTGGRALKFYSSVRIDIRKGEAIKIGNDTVGNRTKIKITKNKVAPPFKICEVDVMYGEGISKIGDLLDLGATLNLVNKSGSWFSYGETRLGQGRENAKLYMKDHPELCHEIENAARRHFGMKELEALALPENYIAVDPSLLDISMDDDNLEIELIDMEDLSDMDELYLEEDERSESEVE